MKGRLPSKVRRVLALIRDWDYLRKWLLLGAVIGVVAGLAAIAFIYAIEGAGTLLLEGIGGYEPPLPRGEGNRLAEGEFTRPWAIPLVVGLGGLISGVLVFRWAPEAEGHGTDSAIAAIHHNPRSIRPRVTVIKLLASAATIGSGGSAGREGPTAQISAGFGSLLARKMDLSPQDARIAVTVGTGAGIGAIFRAPLGGAVLGTEILYRDDLEPEALLPSLVASIVGFSLFGAVEGFTPIFGTLHTPQFDHPVQLGYYAMLGIAAGLAGRVYARTFYGTTRLSKRLPGAPWIKPAVAGVLVGLIGLAFPEALSTGYGWLQIGMRDGLPDTALWVILLLPVLKIVTTSLSIGSGGSGGIFGPGMVVGGFVGLAVWRVLHDVAPDVPDVPAPFMVVGMIACFGSIAHAPLGLMLMVAEMTGSLALLPPAMLAIGVAAVVVRQDTIYESQIRSRAEAPGHRARFGLPLLGSTPAREVMRRPRLVLDGHVSLAQARQMMTAAGVEHAPVVEGERFAGVVRRNVHDGPPTVGEAVDSEFPTVSTGAHLDAALDAMLSAGVGWLPVIENNRVRGVLAMSEVIGGYQTVLRRMMRRLAGISGRAALLELTVADDAPVVGERLGSVPWPPGALAVTVDRPSSLVSPGADTVLRRGDVVVVIAPTTAETTLSELFGDVANTTPAAE